MSVPLLMYIGGCATRFVMARRPSFRITSASSLTLFISRLPASFLSILRCLPLSSACCVLSMTGRSGYFVTEARAHAVGFRPCLLSLLIGSSVMAVWFRFMEGPQVFGLSFQDDRTLVARPAHGGVQRQALALASRRSRVFDVRLLACHATLANQLWLGTRRASHLQTNLATRAPPSLCF